MTATDWTSSAPGTGQYAQVNGINLYFETHGSGRPLILLHGGLGSGEMFGPILPALTERHQVIAPDLQGHGRTSDIDRPIDIRFMADDIAALIDHLGLDRPDVVGYSLGGGVALQTAVKHPAKVGRLVAASANIRRDHPVVLGEAPEHRAEHLARPEPAVEQDQRSPRAMDLVVEVDAVDRGVGAGARCRGGPVGAQGDPPGRVVPPLPVIITPRPVSC